MLNMHQFLALILVGTLLLITPAAHSQGMPPARVRVGTIEQQNLQTRWDVIGRLVERKRSIVAAEQSGKIIHMQVNDGDPVVAGKTVLAKIDDVWAKLNLQQIQAELEQAQAQKREAESQLKQEQRDLTFYVDLVAKNSARPKEVDDARTAVETAQARLTSAKANEQIKEAMHKQANEQLARLTVLAPFNGVVIRKHTEVGQWVNQGDAVVEIISTEAIEAHVDIPESLVNNLTANDLTALKIDPLDKEIQGRIIAIIPDGSSAARTFPVHILIDNPKGELKVGMSVTAHIPTSQIKPCITVPRDAILSTSQGAAIWVNMDGKAIRVDVKILFGLENRYAIKPNMPLQPGMQVVIEGAERLFPTQPLDVINP